MQENISFCRNLREEGGVNMNINELSNFHLVMDEYGNYYEVNRISHKNNELTEVTLSNIYFEKSFQRLFNLDGENEKYKDKHIGVFLQDLVNGSINNYTNKHGKIYSVRELVENGVKVNFMDITAPHPRSNPIK